VQFICFRAWRDIWILLCLFSSQLKASTGLPTDGDTNEPSVTQPALNTAEHLVASPEFSVVSSWPMVVMTLLGIVALIFCLGWFAKRFGGFGVAGNADIRVVGAVPLGARERVALIDVKGQQFLLGVTAQNINHLHSFDEPVIDLGKMPKTEFAQKLQSILKTNKSASEVSD